MSTEFTQQVVAEMIQRKSERRPPPEGMEYWLPAGATELQLRPVAAAPAAEHGPELEPAPEVPAEEPPPEG